MNARILAAPSRVIELDAAVSGAALLLKKGGGLLGLLAGGPARLVLVPLGGGAARTVALPVAAPQEIALLSSEVALARTGDGAVWAISGLSGEPRPKQVARDVRALCARPNGESALGLGEGSTATALTLSRDEVAARTFTLRGGALRACDVGEQVTYAVTDGEGGGTFRVHPGATPELGTSARAALPAEAAGLDRVRGGAALSVLYKRGSELVCVITGGPRTFTARMVTLPGKIADVAVVEGLLAAIFVEGRAAIYDVDSLGGELAEGMALGARGRPKIALGTGKSLWLGTTSGEILRLAIDETSAPIEAPVIAAKPEPLKVEEPIAAEPEAEPVTEPEPVIAEEPVIAAPDLAARVADLEEKLSLTAQALVDAAARRERDVAVAVRGEREEGERALADAQRELGEARAELEVVRAELASKTEELGAAEAKIHALGLEIVSKVAARDAFREQADAARAESEAGEHHAEALAVELAARTAERDALQAESEKISASDAAARKEADHLRAEGERARAEAALSRKEIERLRAEGDRLRAELRSERDRPAAPASRPGDGVINYDRAKEKLDSVLTQVQNVLKGPKR